jgi:protein-ribulosamine 3-kinase
MTLAFIHPTNLSQTTDANPTPMLAPALLQHLAELTGSDLSQARSQPVGGGDINAAYRLSTPQRQWFIKINRAVLADMFAAEAQGLQELAAQHCIRVPDVIAQGQYGAQAFLVLEYIELHALHGASARLMGQQLARLHRIPQPYFGWQRDNTIGSTPQSNQRHHDWVSFWQQQRLGKQLQIAAHNGYRGQLQKTGERLIDALPAFFSDYSPQPSLLHGDLWGGNASADANGQPVIYDPACYYGDRESDLAMTELFAGFGADFYSAYRQEYPLDQGYTVRKTLYNLYHILNHLNLFGGGYAHQAQHMMEHLLAQTG